MVDGWPRFSTAADASADALCRNSSNNSAMRPTTPVINNSQMPAAARSIVFETRRPACATSISKDNMCMPIVSVPGTIGTIGYVPGVTPKPLRSAQG